MPPNVLIITLHDSGRFMGCYGHDWLHTPRIDALARDAMRLTNIYGTCCICSPSRASMLTGRHPASHGVMHLPDGKGHWELHNPREHLSHLLQSHGYDTALCGMQHETADATTLGFDHRALRASDNRGTGNAGADVVARAAAEYLHSRAAQARPFYLQVGFHETHTPYDYGGAAAGDPSSVVMPPYVVDNDAARRHLAGFTSCLALADRAVGIILDALRDAGRDDDTIVVFTADHGIELPRAKWSLFDAGIEIPMLIRWSGGGVTGGRTCDRLLSNVDFLPTLLQLLDLPTPTGVEGVSFAPLLAGAAPGPSPRDAVYAIWGPDHQRCVRTDRYKLIRTYHLCGVHAGPANIEQPLAYGHNPPIEFYDLHHDPLEYENLAEGVEAYADHAAAFERLSRMLDAHLAATNDPIVNVSPTA